MFYIDNKKKKVILRFFLINYFGKTGKQEETISLFVKYVAVADLQP